MPNVIRKAFEDVMVRHRIIPYVCLAAMGGALFVSTGIFSSRDVHAQTPQAAPFYCLSTDETGDPINNSQRICFPLSSISAVFPDPTTPQIWLSNGGTLGFVNAEWDKLADFA